jgi:AbrB family looped-hinge helix DNA binding protein
MAAATLSSKYQISVPKEVRESQGWKPGQKLAFVPRDGGVALVPVPTMAQLRGIAAGADTRNYRDRSERD